MGVICVFGSRHSSSTWVPNLWHEKTYSLGRGTTCQQTVTIWMHALSSFTRVSLVQDILVTLVYPIVNLKAPHLHDNLPMPPWDESKSTSPHHMILIFFILARKPILVNNLQKFCSVRLFKHFVKLRIFLGFVSTFLKQYAKTILDKMIWEILVNWWN